MVGKPDEATMTTIRNSDNEVCLKDDSWMCVYERWRSEECRLGRRLAFETEYDLLTDLQYGLPFAYLVTMP